MTDYRVGIDVGGTNMNAVVMDGDDNLLAKTKTPTTENITSGILSALDVVLNDSGVSEDELDYVMLGTVYATSAITERRGLSEVGVIRIGAPTTQSIRPFLEWPDDLAAAIGNNVAILDGGHEFDGQLLNDLDEEQVRVQIREFSDMDAFAVTSVSSPVRDDHETRVVELIREEVGDDVPISVPNEIGSVGLLERENATAFNATLTSVASKAANASVDATNECGTDVNLYSGQNDGMLTSVDYVIRYPILTVVSGPSNSVRGAAYLSTAENGVIVDVGGTTTDVDAVTEGFPHKSSVAVEISEVKTNFRMSDIIAIGIGGGSIASIDGGIIAGPQSVGYKLTEEAKCFGGETPTVTDLEVAAGITDIGSETSDIDGEIVEAAREYVRERVEREVDRMETSAEPVLAVIVGGGSIPVPDDIAGASEVHKPDHCGVANAVGAAIVQVSGEVDRIYSLNETDREEATQHAKDEATDNALAAGADTDTVDIVDTGEVPLSYLPGNAVRIKVETVGAFDH